MILNIPHRVEKDVEKMSIEERSELWDKQTEQENRIIKNINEISNDPSDMIFKEMKACMMLLAGATPNCSSFIDELTVTYGYGKLDSIGSWEYQIPTEKIYKKLFMKNEKWSNKTTEECNSFFCGIGLENFRSLIVDYLNN